MTATAEGGIERLNAFDGLYLRAEHLNLIQDYARDLALAVGAAGGPGVVSGLEATLQDGALRIGPGLAVDPSGRPLRARQEMIVPLGELTPSADTFWYVEAVSEIWTHGDEAVQGLLCDDPCANGSTAHPFATEGVRIRLTEAKESGLAGWSHQQRRARLASRIFAAEAVAAGAWSREPADPASSLAGRDWQPPPEPAGTGPQVRLAVLIPAADLRKWQVDVWAVRRDRGASPPAREWQWRLAMRPWEVFVAQILQFQAMLDYPEGVSTTVAIVKSLRGLADEIRRPRVTKAQIAERVQRFSHDLAGGRVGEEGGSTLGSVSLPELGIDELPPAGFLPYHGSLEQVGTAMAELLGRGASLRVCWCGPADVAQAVQEAQHRDRIRLDPARPADVDILVPVGADREQAAFDWVAFVGRARVACAIEADAPPLDEVKVWLVDVGSDRAAFEAAMAALKAGTIPEAARSLATLRYPERSWAAPDDADYAVVFRTLQALATFTVIPVAVVRAEERQPLGALRAALLAAAFSPEGTLTPRPPRAIVAGPDEAVVLVATLPRVDSPAASARD
jgi:hypothetical protein